LMCDEDLVHILHHMVFVLENCELTVTKSIQQALEEFTRKRKK
jgi:hypothetical protein